MKSFFAFLLILTLVSCSNSKSVDTGADYSAVDKYIGKWCAEGKAEEVISVMKAGNFDSTHVCLVNDGKTEFAFPFIIKENKFKLRQPEYWVEISHDETSNQLLWKVTRYDESEGKIVRKYKFKGN